MNIALFPVLYCRYCTPHCITAWLLVFASQTLLLVSDKQRWSSKKAENPTMSSSGAHTACHLTLPCIKHTSVV